MKGTGREAWWASGTGLEVIKLFPCSAQLRLKFILLINVKMPTIVGIFSSPARSAQSYCCHLGRTRLRLRVRPSHTFG